MRNSIDIGGRIIQPKVLLMTGWGRSGSTLLGDVLGAADGVCHVGELRGIWHHMMPLSAAPCGCGVHHRECPFWRDVFARAFPGESPAQLGYLEHMRERRLSMRPRAVLALRRDLNSETLTPMVTEYVERLTRIYGAVADVSGSELIVDSSKNPGYARLLSVLAGVPTFVLHLVRDPRAIAYSWERKPIYGTTFTPSRSSASWLVANLLSERLTRSLPAPRSRFLRYEDFSASPRRTVARLLEWLEVDATGPEWPSEGVVRLEPNHSVVGNPSRFVTGEVTVRPDDEWKSRLGAGAALAATIPALPRLGRYGYPLHIGGSARPPKRTAVAVDA